MAAVRTRFVALAGLAGLVPVALGMVRGSITVEAAAVRAAVLLALVVLVDRVVVPIVRDLVRAGRSE
jgi:hypothetical protein